MITNRILRIKDEGFTYARFPPKFIFVNVALVVPKDEGRSKVAGNSSLSH